MNEWIDGVWERGECILPYFRFFSLFLFLFLYVGAWWHGKKDIPMTYMRMGWIECKCQRLCGNLECG